MKCRYVSIVRRFPRTNSTPRRKTSMARQIGEVILDLQNISLRFGGVKALTNISFKII